MQRRDVLLGYYQAMLSASGPRNWWPAKTPFEICVGAVLTQNTAWKGVEKALSNLELAGALDPHTLHSLSLPELERLIHPAGYFRVKARRLRNLLDYLSASCDFDLGLLAERDMADVRGELLEVSGIGPETADSILCYALQMPSFVVDASTRRILSRHGLLPEDADYEETRDFFMDVLDPDPALLGALHAQLVGVGNQYCKTRNQLCDTCPLGSFLS